MCAAPLYAQEADTTEADTTTADTTAVESGAADTTEATADTLQQTTDTRTGDPAVGRATPDAATERQATDAATKSAEEWLALTDAGEFGESWDAADSTLQAQISREDWIDQGRRAHSRLDTLHSRTLSSTQYRQSVPQIDGQQPVVILLYDSEYDAGATREAVITTRRDSGWKVAGYRVIPAQVAADTTGEASEENAQ